ncbi:unnamed protein product [Fusarium graminearum]|nr:unnamed protein product [Fusarium graminearum]
MAKAIWRANASTLSASSRIEQHKTSLSLLLWRRGDGGAVTMTIVRPTAFVILLASFFRKFGKTLYPGRDTIPYQWKGIVKGTVRRKLMAFNGPVWGYGLTLQSDQACSLRGGAVALANAAFIYRITSSWICLSSSLLGFQSLSTLRPSRESPSPFTNGSRNSRTKSDRRKLATGHIDGFPFAIHGHSVDLDDNGNISFRTQLVGYSSTSSSSGTRPSARRSSVLGRIQWLQNSDDGTEFWENGQQFQAPGGEDFAWIHILYEQPSILERVKEW